MYKESTERDHASAPTLAPHSNFPAKARTLLHPICSSLPTPSPLRSSPAQTDLPRPQHFPYPPHKQPDLVPHTPHPSPDQRRTKQGIPSHSHREDRRKGYLQAIVFYMYLRTALAQPP